MYEYSTVVLSKVAEPTTLKIVRPLETVTQDASISPLDDTRKPSHQPVLLLNPPGLLLFVIETGLVSVPKISTVPSTVIR